MQKCLTGKKRNRNGIGVRVYYLLFGFLLFSFSTSYVYATTFIVSNTSDNGANSLRQAIVDANAAGGTNTINIILNAPGTLLLASNLPPISNTALTIDASTAPNLIIDGNNVASIFSVYSGPFILNGNGMRLNQGRAQGGNGGNGGAIGGGGAGLGGAVFAGAGISTTITDVIFTNNSAIGGNGSAFAGQPGVGEVVVS